MYPVLGYGPTPSPKVHVLGWVPAPHLPSCVLCWVPDLHLLLPVSRVLFLSHTLFLQPEASDQWDCVLVADLRTQKIQEKFQRQQRFLAKLENKGFHIKVGWFASGAKSRARELWGMPCHHIPEDWGIGWWLWISWFLCGSQDDKGPEEGVLWDPS